MYTIAGLLFAGVSGQGCFGVRIISQLDYLPDGQFAGHQVHCWRKCTQVSRTLGAVVSVGMGGMLGMPGKLGMLVPPAGFSIFGGGGLRNVPTRAGRPAREPRRPGGAELLLNQHFQSSQFRLCPRLSLQPEAAAAPRVCWGQRDAGRGAPDTPPTQPERYL